MAYYKQAQPFYRPSGDSHPDLYRVGDSDSTLLRGKFIRSVKSSTRVPDVSTHDWFYKKHLRDEWKRNWFATGDHRRPPDQGLAPPGWSSYQGKPPSEEYHYRDVLKRRSDKQGAAPGILGGRGSIATWSKWTYAAHSLQTTQDPVTFQDGGPDLGPRWAKVTRRVTYDMHSRQVLEDVVAKGLTRQSAAGPIPHTPPGKGRDIVPEFYFRRGAWPTSSSVNTHDAPVPQASDTERAATKREGSPSSPRFQVPDDVLASQAAMGCPLRGYPIPSVMPVLPPAAASDSTRPHRERNPALSPMVFDAVVARPVGRKERNSTPKALEAVAKEWQRLRTIKHRDGVGVWDESRVREKSRVRHEARDKGITMHFARIFDLCVEKGSELPLGDPDRRFKGRAVLQGDQVIDQNWEAALFQDLSSSPAGMEASRAADAYGMLEGHDIEVADADSAYTQSYLESDIPTWVSLPREQWPQAWIDEGYRDPVCPLVLSLYGHPDAGGYWERHCDQVLQDKGWTPIPGWRSCYWHSECTTLLMVYVDDFKMAGPKAHKKRLWSEIRGDPDRPEDGGIYMGKSALQNRFLGCEHILTTQHDTWL